MICYLKNKNKIRFLLEKEVFQISGLLILLTYYTHLVKIRKKKGLPRYLLFDYWLSRFRLFTSSKGILRDYRSQIIYIYVFFSSKLNFGCLLSSDGVLIYQNTSLITLVNLSIYFS